MKKQLRLAIILLACVAIVSSCTKKDVIPSSKLKNNNKLASAGDGLNDVLGYGYDVTGEYANSSAAKYLIVDVERLRNDEPNRVEIDFSSRKYGELISGENAISYLAGLTSKLGASLSIADPEATPSTDPKVPSIPLFKGSIDRSFDNSEYFLSKYVYSSYSLKIQQKRVKINADINKLKQYLTSTFVSDVQNGTPQSIVSAYGTHILKDIVLGAKLNILYRAETNKTDRKEAATRGIEFNILGIFGINTKTTTNTQTTSDNTNQKLVYDAIGGEPSAELTGSIVIGSSLPVINTKPWENSSSLQNAEMIDISEDGLIPIWELIDDVSKRAAVKAYVTQYIINKRPKMEEFALGMYKITSVNSNQILTIPNYSNSSSYNNGTRACQWPWYEGIEQKWRVEKVENNLYKIINAKSNHALTVPNYSGSSYRNGTEVCQWSWYNGIEQKWKIEKVENGKYKIVNAKSGHVLTIPNYNSGSTLRNGTEACQWAWYDGNEQKWSVSLIQAL